MRFIDSMIVEFDVAPPVRYARVPDANAPRFIPADAIDHDAGITDAVSVANENFCEVAPNMYPAETDEMPVAVSLFGRTDETADVDFEATWNLDIDAHVAKYPTSPLKDTESLSASISIRNRSFKASEPIERPILMYESLFGVTLMANPSPM